ATLQCRAIGHPPPTISWQRDGVPLENIDHSRYTVLPDGNLLIMNAQLEDQTRFTCIAKNEYGQQSKTTMVMIIGLVSPVLGHVPPEEQLIEGEDLRLSCVVVLGTPKPDIKWFKDGVPVEPSSSVIIEGGGSSLLLRNGNPADEGRYTCAAISPAGNATLNVNVQLIKKPEFIVDEHEPPAELSVREGQSMELPCRVRGTPTPAVTWSLDGRPISVNSKDYTITQDNTLVIINADKASAGTYTCTAMNPAGESEQSTYVSVIAVPVISPGQSSFNLIQGTPVTIPCDVYMDPMPEIKWFGLQQEGQLKCVASNEAGEDERVVTLTVHTAPIIDGSGQTVSKIVLVNETVSLPCPARAIPPPIRIWSYEGQNMDTIPIHHEVTEEGELILPSVQLDNTGHYTCLVSNLAGDDSITYSLEVHEKPQIVSETPGTIDVVKGLTLEIPCKARGTPEPERIWKKDGIQIGQEETDTTMIDSAGTLRIMNTQTNHGGQYTCEVTNAVGSDSRVTTVVVQEPPVILPATITNYTSVEGDLVEIRCHVEASPPAEIQWSRRGVPITESTPGVSVNEPPVILPATITNYTSVEGDLVEIRCHVEASPPAEIQWSRRGVPITESTPGVSVNGGTLIIQSVNKEDAAFYTCKASNPAGKTEKVIRLSVIVPPDIPDQDSVVLESVKIHQPFSLYCPVFSTPLPTITWYLDDTVMSDGDPNVILSEDKRRLHVIKARTTDAGVYKCVARNLAGESSKTFDVEVIVPLNVDESEWKRKVSVFEGQRVELGYPLVIDNSTVDHAGTYHCVAQHKAGSLDVDIELTVRGVCNVLSRQG
ncbi:immunoglobulin I-set domain protein, partial [Ancylostoma duodenale]